MNETNFRLRTAGTAASPSAGSALSTNKVLRNTYLMLSMTLLFSAATAGISMAIGAPPLPWWALLIGMFGLLFLVHKTKDSAAGIASVFAFTGFFGFFLGPVISAYLALPGGGQIVATSLLGTGAIFLGLSAYAVTTRKDFSYMRGFLLAGLIAVVVLSIANIFMGLPWLSLAISVAAIVVFSGLILFDTSRIINGGETNYLMATIALYLDIYNIFISLLNITGFLSGDD